MYVLAFCPFPHLSSSAPLERYARARLSLQFYAGGLHVYSGGTANLDGCNVYSNEAEVRVRLPPLPGPLLQRPAGTLHMTCTRVLVFLRSIVAVGSM